MADPTFTLLAQPGSDLRPVSPAAHLADRFIAETIPAPRSVSLREVPFLAMIGIRVQPGEPVAERVESLLGSSLPPSCGAVTATGDTATLWLAPDDFLVVSTQPPPVLATALIEAIGDGPGSAADLSANRTTFELTGTAAREVMEKGCPLNLHPRAWPAGAAYVTALGPVPVIIWQLDHNTYRILLRSSFADYLGRWLLDAASEFAGPELV